MAKICKLRNIEKVYNIEEAKNRQDKSKLCISVEHCFSIFESNIIDFDQVTQLEITSDRTYCFSDEPHDNFALNFLKFRNIEYLSIKNIYIIEPDTWRQFALNCTKLKEIFFYGHGCELSKEYIKAILKTSSLETLSFLYTDLNYWPPGPSNIKNIDLTSICSNTVSHPAGIKIEYEHFYTHQNLEEINIKHFAFPISVLNLDKCLNLTTITIQIYEVNLYEFVEKILQLPKLNKITFNCCYFEKFVTDNSLIFPSVKEIYLNDCYKIDNGQQYRYRDRFQEPFKHSLRLIINQCPKLKILMFDNEVC